jgi:hypothetical protein
MEITFKFAIFKYAAGRMSDQKEEGGGARESKMAALSFPFCSSFSNPSSKF